MAIETLYSVQDSAKALGGISVWTVRSWLSQSRLRAVKIGSRTMIPESELQRIIREGSEAQADEGAAE